VHGTEWSRGLEVTGGGSGVVSHAGLVLLRQLADRTGLTAGLSSALPSPLGAVLPAGDVPAMLGPGADGWAALGILVIPGVYDLEVRARDGELLGLIERGGQGAGYDPPHPSEPVTYRAVVREAAEAWPAPAAVKLPGGFVPPDLAGATANERARRGGTGTGTAGGVSVTTAAAAYDTNDPCPYCTCCGAYRCHPGPDSGCPWSERLGDYACPCTGG
jgi:hypothetical protein